MNNAYNFLHSVFPGRVVWNFATKFVIGPDGIPVQRFDAKEPWTNIEKCLQAELDKLKAKSPREVIAVA
eukprot:CAMPEP_0114675984 /NCGR_PEP_ID=MMETSP0191-20121206/48611_1 /TAXON_ID=126664 /ORGANISM="Sorites sp." /LENGTH=68 /DNA_ID=CAMNT_0001946187 /DNA_START=486 /DNA_END=688 /DNA_ORIENTATION=-